MRESMAQQKRHAPCLWTKITETEKGRHKGEDQGRLDGISLEGQMRSLHANMDPPPEEGNISVNSNCSMKPHIVERYNQYMGYTENSDCMANSYLIGQRTFKWTTKLFLHLLDITELNSWILLSSCVGK